MRMRLAHADSANDVRLMIKLGMNRGNGSLINGLDGVSLIDGKG